MDLESLGLKNLFTFQEKDSKDIGCFYDITKTAQGIFGDIIQKAGVGFSSVSEKFLEKCYDQAVNYIKADYSIIPKSIGASRTKLDFDSNKVILFFTNGKVVTIDSSEWGWLESVKEEDKQFQW